ncbi:S24 family peptidase [Lactococcus petauri]|uniref:S24 family peptidase n=1 Tax=Lactococcus petauri TaxID=1940789 RepID=UPI0038523310
MARGRGHSTPQDEENKKIISSNLNKLLSDTNTKKIDIHRATEIPVSTLTGYFQAQTLPNAGNLQKLADFFGVYKSDIDPRFADDSTIKIVSSNNEPLIEETVETMKKLEEPRQKIVLDTAKIQLTEQEKVIEEAKKRERKILGLNSKPIDITKIPGYMPYEPDKMGTAPILGEIAAGYNIMAEENFDGMMPVSAEYAGRDDVFWLNIKGKSMESLIHDGSFGLFECSDDIYDGRIGAVMAEDGDWITVKRIYHNLDENGYLLGLTLVPENDECPTIEINEYNPGKIIGTLLEVKQYF